MFRLTFLLCAAIFLTMLIGGRDHGQLRFGLIPQAEAPVLQAVAAPEPAGVPAVAAIQPRTAPVVVEASFVPARPLMEAQPVAAEPAVAVAEAVVEAPGAPAGRILYVAAKSVNVRSGPGKDHEVVERLLRGEAVLVVAEGEGPEGWSLIRIEGDGVEGYVAARLLSE